MLRSGRRRYAAAHNSGVLCVSCELALGVRSTVLAPISECGESFPDQTVGVIHCYVGVVIRRAHLSDIERHDIGFQHNLADKAQQVDRRKTAGRLRAGGGGEARVEHVDIDRNVDGLLRELPHAVTGYGIAVVDHLEVVENIHLQIEVIRAGVIRVGTEGPRAEARAGTIGGVVMVGAQSAMWQGE